MTSIISKIRSYVEPHAFGVCTYLGKKLGIASYHVRLFFIYATFIANWSPIILYMVLAFWMNMKKFAEEKKSKIWDL